MRRGPSHEAAHHVVREQLEKEDGVVGMEVVARDLADSPAGLELTNRRLDLGASVVLEGNVGGVREPVVRRVGSLRLRRSSRNAGDST